jgi:multicomponent Na+:H+ antiporter subunit D
MGSLPPALIFVVGALVVAVTKGNVRRVVLLAIPVIGALYLRLGLQIGDSLEFEMLGYTLVPLKVDKLAMMFGYLFHLAAFIGNLFALHLEKEDGAGVQHTSAVLYAGAAIGAVYTGDLISLFVFWELLAFTSVFLIWARKTERSFRAGFRYLVIHVL